MTSTYNTDVLINQFRRDGYIVIGPLLSPKQIDLVKEKTRALASGEIPTSGAELLTEPEFLNGKRNPKSQYERTCQIIGVSRAIPELEDYITNPSLLDLLENILGRPLYFNHDHAFLKHPNGGLGAPLHQDHSYWCDKYKPSPIVSCWVALDNATIDNGCLRVWPGSHLKGVLPFTTIPGRYKKPVKIEGVPKEDLCDIEIPAGYAILLSNLLVHGSKKNLSIWPRRALIWVYHSVEPDIDPATTPLLKYKILRK
jgi:ectoine hydroxylase-related dioxygenase (phytanoyl-CoA dioxygenase family)